MDRQWVMNLLGVSRAPFLSLSFVTVFFAWSLAVYQTGLPSFLDAFLILVAMVASHVGVNALNEYQDFQSGLDGKTHRTMFSGGSGTLIVAPEFAESARKIAYCAIGLALLIGFWFVLTVGIELLPIGVLGLWIVLNYTSRINRHPWLCLVSPGLGIGILAGLGSVYILSGTLSFTAILLACGYALLLNNLLLLNQFPDIEADRSVERTHLWIAYGKPFALAVFTCQWLMAFFLILSGVGFNVLPWYSVLILAGVSLAYPLIMNTRSIELLEQNLVSCLGKNVILCHFYPAFMGLVVLISRTLS